MTVMTEFDLIKRLTPLLATNGSVVNGAGDDCAVLDLGIPGKHILFKTDAIVEGIHFTPDTSPEKIGRKALARCLSDIAAMAGTPNSALITLGLPREFSVEQVDQIYSGINSLATKWGVAIVGGETTTSTQGIFISISMIGLVEKGRCILRSGAKKGDAIFVTGELGGSIEGHHLEFEPRITEAQWLAEHFQPHCMMDVSDGIAGDLQHLLTMSGAGAELMGQSIPIRRAAKLAARERSTAKPALLAALTDGEDFELLFTVPSRKAVPLLDAWKKQFPEIRLTCIGKITDGDGILLRDKNGTRKLNAHGYVHLQQP
jgi:thiamine-monophosphate kinase